MKTQTNHFILFISIVSMLNIQVTKVISQVAPGDTAIITYDVFKDPPAEFRGIKWAGFGLTNLSDTGIIKSIHYSVKSGFWGSFLLGSGGGPTTGLSEAYLKASKRTPGNKGIVYLSEE